MATQTQIRLGALCLWSCLLILFASLDYRLKQTERFLTPENIKKIEIIQKESQIELQLQGKKWIADGKTVREGRVEQMLDILASCHSPQPLADVKAPASRPVILNISGQRYTLGAYNSYHHAHYLDDGKIAWLCSENLKAMLAQPPEHWYSNAKESN
ncbi:MAG: hypothetical protein Q4A74_08620 [Cardiobacteriaceae bacterium]|nr:hypothetical protein [Cardiobacteriaceae bacterium]